VETFRRAFLDVWGRVAAPDRRQLLTYWREQPDRALRADRYRPRHATVRIRVEDLVEGVDWSPAHSACRRLGHELAFPTSLVAGGQDRLPQVIARTLALALRYATGRHWGLILERIEGPMERWERRAGKHADDATRAAKLDRLEADYLAAYEAEIAGILRGWGFDPRALGADQPGRESDGV
jgi:hypothetical protein